MDAPLSLHFSLSWSIKSRTWSWSQNAGSTFRSVPEVKATNSPEENVNSLNSRLDGLRPSNARGAAFGFLAFGQKTFSCLGVKVKPLVIGLRPKTNGFHKVQEYSLHLLSTGAPQYQCFVRILKGHIPHTSLRMPYTSDRGCAPVQIL